MFGRIALYEVYKKESLTTYRQMFGSSGRQIIMEGLIPKLIATREGNNKMVMNFSPRRLARTTPTSSL